MISNRKQAQMCEGPITSSSQVSSLYQQRLKSESQMPISDYFKYNIMC